ncbi:hypothetical protein NEOLEDRAFT_1154163 [Neolentinus lepideus HHB14362 ss-1]|uniref:BZIP domain-containing protein n=1 Tax=Neolentinus lepideus HHB14362 ss-1 TaxID=1314782 RepID=A0A165V428_9AGAM|nr:hypothetical protein NEOLEDRAFT_1154163 [Neolentinus lepideus HHB14362 ss-1]
MDNSFIDPISLSLPSPSDSTSTVPSVPDSHAEGPSRKRQRSDGTSEERREARMHRNRIAAQNSRDKRKAQFTFLERRVAELEEENRQLRASLGVQGIATMQGNVMTDQEKKKARDRENEELKERIKTLEKGWETVIKALASQGLSTGLPFTPSTPASKPETSTSTLPVIVPSSPVYPISPALSNTSALPSPGPLYADGSDFTRHSARVATIDPTSMSLQRQVSVLETTAQTLPTNTTTTSVIDESAMDNLFREILVDPPTSAFSPDVSPALVEYQVPSYPSTSPVTTAAQITQSPVVNVEDWEREQEMQRLLDLLPSVQGEGPTDSAEFISSLDFDIDGWDMDSVLVQSSVSSQLGVF